MNWHLICGLEALGEQCLRQSPIDERAFVEAKFVVEKSRFVHHTVGTKKFKCGCIGDSRRTSFTWRASPFPQSGTAQCQEKPWLACLFLLGGWWLRGGRERVGVWPSPVSQLCGHCYGHPHLSCSTQSIESWTAWPGVKKRLGKQQVELWVRDFPGGSVVMTSPCSSGGASSIPGQGAKSSHASGPEKKAKHRAEATL